MNGFLAGIYRKRNPKASAFSLATVVCLVLLTLLAVVQVAHLHPVDQDADHCPLCIVMQSAAPVAVAAAVVLLVQVGRQMAAPEPVAVSFHRHPKLYIRPPPTAC